MIKGLIFSIQFLTRIPLKSEIEMNGRNIAAATFFFPFTGALVGLIAAAAYFMGLYGGRNIAALCAVIACIFITGGLHLDGLSDTCDGFFSSRTRERILEIMKDSHIGSFGVIAIVLDILTKYVLLSEIQSGFAPCLVLACANARLAAVMLMCFTKTARPGGLGAMFSEASVKKYFYMGALIYMALLAILKPVFLITLAAAMAAALLTAMKSYSTIGGLTGDVYGAAIELCEIASMAGFLAVIKWI